MLYRCNRSSVCVLGVCECVCVCMCVCMYLPVCLSVRAFVHLITTERADGGVLELTQKDDHCQTGTILTQHTVAPYATLYSYAHDPAARFTFIELSPSTSPSSLLSVSPSPCLSPSPLLLLKHKDTFRQKKQSHNILRRRKKFRLGWATF